MYLSLLSRFLYQCEVDETAGFHCPRQIWAWIGIAYLPFSWLLSLAFFANNIVKQKFHCNSLDINALPPCICPTFHPDSLSMCTGWNQVIWVDMVQDMFTWRCWMALPSLAACPVHLAVIDFFTNKKQIVNLFPVGFCINGKFSDTNFEIGKPC